jgi:hypothetical protein
VIGDQSTRGGSGTVQVKRLVYYESIKRELKKRLVYEYRCDERLKRRKTKNASQTLASTCFFF